MVVANGLYMFEVRSKNQNIFILRVIDFITHVPKRC